MWWWWTGGDSTSSVQSVTDSKGNVYAAATGVVASTGNYSQQMFYAKNIASAAAGANTVTITFSNSVIDPEVRIAEYSGLDTSNPLDGSVGASGTGLTQSSGALTTTNANDLLVASNGLFSVTTAEGSGYTLRLTSGFGEIIEDEVVTATGSYSAGSTQQSSGYWLMQLVAFRAASAGSPTISSFTPTTGPVGTVITVTGTNLSGASQAWVGSAHDAAVANVSSTTMQMTVPADAPVGSDQLAVVAPGGTVWSGQNFTVTAGGDTTPPTTPGTPSLTVVSSSQINLSWVASTDNVGVTGYRVQRCAGASCTTFAQVGSATTNSYNDTGLTPSTSYSYRIEATDAAGNLSGFSSTASATTQSAADTTPPSAPGTASLTVVSSGQINLSWAASTDNVGVTGYLVERCSGASCTAFAQIGTPTANSYNDSGLTASTSYSYRVRATDAAGNLSSYSGTASATTQAAAAPTIASFTPSTGPVGTVITVTGTNLSGSTQAWVGSAHDAAVTNVSSTTMQMTVPADAPVGSDQLAIVTPGGTVWSGQNFTVTAGGDTTPPTAPGTPGLTVASSTQINLSWTASTDNVGVTGYRVERCSGASCTTFAQIGTPTATSYNDTGLTASTSYSYRIRATDAADNLSSYSSTASATTQTAADTTPPTAPGTPGLTVVSTTQISLSWAASTDNVGVSGYLVERCSGGELHDLCAGWHAHRDEL